MPPAAVRAACRFALPAAFAGALVFATGPLQADHGWDYRGVHGANHWSELSESFAECGRGREQSPIAIDKAVSRPDLPDLAVHYHHEPLSLINNGHTVQVVVHDDEWLDIGEARYRLVQAHFHTPSEERLNGHTYAMELHLVHRDDQGQLAVLGVMIKRGAENPVLGQVFNNMPVGAGPEHHVDEQIDLSALLPAHLDYYGYEGSLTTPPCTEHVHWYVLREPIHASPAQIELFHKLYARNARPLQPLNARQVYQHGS